MIRAFIKAEFFKLRRSRMEKISILFALLTPVVFIGSVWWLGPDYTQYPGALGLMSGSLLMTALISALLVATSVGNEYEWGAVRMIISRGVPRWLFVVGKGAALLSISSLNALAFWLAVLIAVSLSHLGHAAGASEMQRGIAAMFTSGLAAVAIAALAAAAYIGAGLVIGILTRSTSFTTLFGIGLILADFYFSNLQEARAVFANLSIVGNSAVLLAPLHFQMAGDNSGSPGLATAPTTAVLILLAYAVGGVLLAIFLFQRQELED